MGSARHAIEPRSDPKQRAKEDFAHLVAQLVNQGEQAGELDRLVLVAPAHVLRDIKAALDGAALGILAAEASKDLVKLPATELHARLREIIL